MQAVMQAATQAPMQAVPQYCRRLLRAQAPGSKTYNLLPGQEVPAYEVPLPAPSLTPHDQHTIRAAQASLGLGPDCLSLQGRGNTSRYPSPRLPPIEGLGWERIKLKLGQGQASILTTKNSPCPL